MSDFSSILLYFGFFISCLYLDRHRNRKKIIKIFLFCLYLFLCFGYMTGSDWRQYELMFEGGESTSWNTTMDAGFYYSFIILKSIFRDFFLVSAIYKIIYLWSLIRLFKKITEHWLLVLGLYFAGGSLLFMIIDCPMRFMAANIFINLAIPFLLENRILKYILFALPACFFHITCVLIIPTLLLAKIRIPFDSLNKAVLYIVFIVFSFALSSVGAVTDIFTKASIIMQAVGDRAFLGYSVENNESFFSIGSILMLLFAGVLIYFREAILSVKYGKMIFDCSMLYLFLSRVTILVPTGFRMVIPLGLFYFLSFASILYLKKAQLFRYAYFLIISFMLFRNLYNGYSYIPYTNSIYYILTEHKSYSERSEYNPNAYKARTGKTYESGD